MFANGSKGSNNSKQFECLTVSGNEIGCKAQGAASKRAVQSLCHPQIRDPFAAEDVKAMVDRPFEDRVCFRHTRDTLDPACAGALKPLATVEASNGTRIDEIPGCRPRR